MPSKSPRSPLGIALFALAMVTPWVMAAAAGTWIPGVAAELCRKEGPLEHLTHGVLLVALLGHLARLAVPGARRLPHLFPALLCLVFLLEEIDYGQVYLGFDTPPLLRPLTGRSDHLNFHNTTIADALIPAFYGTYLIVLPLLARWERWRIWIRRIRLEPFAATVAPLFFAAAVASYALERTGYAGFDPTEMLDLSATIPLLAAALHPRLLFRGSGLP